jgi:hypothetical protein
VWRRISSVWYQTANPEAQCRQSDKAMKRLVDLGI